ncbi:DUF1772 domain-containing protein [Phreatobacter sp. HK31-P]
MTIAAMLFTLAALIATGLAAGVFYAYATSVMLAFDRLPPQQAIDAMRIINVVILNPVFFASFLGAVVLLPSAAILAWLSGLAGAAALLLAATLAYGLGTFGVTIAVNVPLNEALARLPPASAAPAADWAAFADRWNRWNRIRAASAALALFLTGLSLLAMAG